MIILNLSDLSSLNYWFERVVHMFIVAFKENKFELSR